MYVRGCEPLFSFSVAPPVFGEGRSGLEAEGPGDRSRRLARRRCRTPRRALRATRERQDVVYIGVVGARKKKSAGTKRRKEEASVAATNCCCSRRAKPTEGLQHFFRTDGKQPASQYSVASTRPLDCSTSFIFRKSVLTFANSMDLLKRGSLTKILGLPPLLRQESAERKRI